MQICGLALSRIRAFPDSHLRPGRCQDRLKKIQQYSRVSDDWELLCSSALSDCTTLPKVFANHSSFAGSIPGVDYLRRAT